MEEIILGAVSIAICEGYRLKCIALTEIFVTNELTLADFQISLALS